jgi:hypothetical protein
LEYVEKEFGVTFVPEDLTQNEDSWMDLEELYLALKEKEVIRLNSKVNTSQTSGMKINQQIDSIKVGSVIDITFITKIYYFLWMVKMTLFSANLLSNAIIKEINEASDGEIKILYGSEDSRPMYISYMGFKTEEEAKEEMKEIMNHKADYMNALTVLGYINKRRTDWNRLRKCLAFLCEAQLSSSFPQSPLPYSLQQIITYTNLLTSGRLNAYLVDIDRQAQERFERLIEGMKQAQSYGTIKERKRLRMDGKAQ